MKRTEILIRIAEAIGAENYLEIGIRDPADNFDLMPVKNRIGVDPAIVNSMVHSQGSKALLVKSTSDNYFFSRNKIDLPFDLVFIDGDHSHEQSKRDLDKALKILAPGGVIVMHDALPASPEAATAEKPNSGRAWNGQVYKTVLEARKRKTLRIATVDTDHGCAVIWKSRKKDDYEALPKSYISDVEYPAFDRNDMNLCTVADFPRLLKTLRERT